MRKHLSLLCILVWGVAAACTSPSPPSPVESALPEVTLQPYASSTPQPPTETPSPLAVTPLPTFTATPFVYTVAKDDTLLGIAARFGVTLDALLTANPGVDPRFLTIGMPLTIPLSSQAPLPSETLLLPLEISTPHCTALPDSSQWCVVQVHNPHPQAVTAVALTWGTTSLGSTLPLDVLPPESTLPAAIVLPAGEAPNKVTLRSALPWNGTAEFLPQVVVESRLRQAVADFLAQGKIPAPASAHTAHFLAIGYTPQGLVTSLQQDTIPVTQGEAAYALALHAQYDVIAKVQVWVYWQ